MESLHGVNRGLVAIRNEFTSASDPALVSSHKGDGVTDREEAAARIQGLIQGHRDGLVVEHLLYESENTSASSIQGIVRGKAGRSIARAQLTMEELASAANHRAQTSIEKRLSQDHQQQQQHKYQHTAT